MGADGGLCWMSLRDAQQHQRVTELLEPLTLLSNTWHDADWEWVRMHPPPANTFVTSYATGNSHQGLLTLRRILSEENELEPLTFEDLALDLATRPWWQLHQLTALEEVLLIALSWGDWYETRFGREFRQAFDQERPGRVVAGLHTLGKIRTMPIADWVLALKSLLQWQKPTVIETWT